MVLWYKDEKEIVSDIISKFIKKWDWHNLSFNKNITFEHVFAYPNKPWDWSTLSNNPNITFKKNSCISG